ncbi:MAG: translation initiation factor IF-2 [Dictyoglomi bacterium]|nr:translation initiation factor IF-2 [Dictyoglomota bacterium]
MSKIRVYKLAKELGVSSKELMHKLDELGVEVKSHMSTLDDETAEAIREIYSEEEEVVEVVSDKEKIIENTEEITSVEEQKEEEKAESEATEEVEEEESMEEDIKILEIEKGATLSDVADMLGVSATDLVKVLFMKGMMVKPTSEVNDEVLEVLSEEYSFLYEWKEEAEEEEEEEIQVVDRSKLKPRPPVVTVMGHVDHGKTTLLDAIRGTSVAAREAGGITQSIGASVVEINGRKITFIDTPGHEAFTAMRARGAQVTDIVVLVVAATEGVKPQTIEAVNHAKAAGVPIIVAVNKIDVPGANPDVVKQQLSQYDLLPEEWGGTTPYVNVSALKKIGIEDLLETILLVADIELEDKLLANYDAPARGFIIESKLDKGRGPVATVIVKDGTLHKGDAVVIETVYGKVRAIFDDKRRQIKEVTPGLPGEIMGLSDVPPAGAKLKVVESERLARELAEKELEKRKEKEQKERQKVLSLEDFYVNQGDKQVLNIILRADTDGSLEAIKGALFKMKKPENIDINIIHTGIGAITENDVMLAEASKAIILGFNVRPPSKVQKLAQSKGIIIKTYRIIYQLLEEMEAMLKGMLQPKEVEKVIGHAEVRKTFKVPKVGTVAGLYVTDGKMTRNARIRVIRDGVIVADTKVLSLKRFKEDVREVAAGYECGMGLEKFNDIKEGDIFEAYVIEMVKEE